MNTIRYFVLALSVLFAMVSCNRSSEKTVDVENARIKALLINGQMNNSHDDRESSPIIEKILESTGEFNVVIATTPAKGKDMSTFTPHFSDYDVVILDYDGDHWPAETKTAFVDYVSGGGGVVVVHSADNAFPDWKEYNEIIGLGGWGGRDENHGPYVYWENGEIVRNDTIGKGGHHGSQTPVLVETRIPDHPIMEGLPSSWMHTKDELYANLRGPAKNMEILATAYSDPKTNGSGRHEPTLFTVRYGQGKVFHTVFGHVNGKGPHISMECAGFITTLQRGAEWAATGEVTLPVPAEFPNAASWIRWENLQPLSLEELVAEIKKYEIGDSREHISALSARIRTSDQKKRTLKTYENAMIDILKSNATADAKKEICRELRIWGTSASVPALKKLEADKECAEMAAYTLAAIQGN